MAGALALGALPGTGQAQGARPLDLRVVMSGHSLTDPVPEPLQAMVRAAGGPLGTIEPSTIPGSPLEWRWNNAPDLDLRAEIGRFDVLVLTERVPLSNTMPWHHSADVALRFAELAWQQGAGGNGGEVLLYSTWVEIEDGPPFLGEGSDPDAGLPWRERLDREASGWEDIRTHLNQNRPRGAPPVRMVPMLRVMAALYDEVEAGRAPIDTIRAVFSDDIHVNALGAWLAALAHFAVIYRRDPSGLTRPARVPPAVAHWYEALVWRVLTEDPATELA